MTTAVVGVGPIGALIAASLAHAGRVVSLVDVLPSRLDPVRSRGLRLVGPDVQVVTHPDTARLHEVASGVDLAFLDVPHRLTSAACAALDRILSPRGVAVSLQHGLHALWVADLLGRERTVVACAGFDVALSSPTEVSFAAGRFVVGAVGAVPASLPTEVADLLAGAGFRTALAPDVRPHLWSTATVTALTAAYPIVRRCGGDAAEVLAAVARDMAALAAAYGVEVEPKEGLDLGAFAPGRSPEASALALRAWRPTEPDPERASWRRRLDGLAPTAAWAERIGHPLPTAGRLLAGCFAATPSSAWRAGAAADRTPHARGVRA